MFRNFEDCVGNVLSLEEWKMSGRSISSPRNGPRMTRIGRINADKGLLISQDPCQPRAIAADAANCPETIGSQQRACHGVGYNLLDGGTMVNLDELQVQYVTDQAGEKSAVILPIAVFYQLLEDLEDLAVAAERADEPPLSHEQLTDELRADGLLPD